jgi:hypothetical protein
MRHGAAVAGAEHTPLAPSLTPTSLTCGVLDAAVGSALIAPAGGALVGPARRTGARPPAVALTAVAVAAQQHLLATASAQEQAGWDVGQARSSGHPPRAPSHARHQHALDAIVRRCNTDAAPATARCRARRGSRCQAMRPPPCPPLEPLRAVLPPPQRRVTSIPRRSARSPRMAALQGGHARGAQHNVINANRLRSVRSLAPIKTAASPSNRRGS